jgi:hypothetical protein
MHRVRVPQKRKKTPRIAEFYSEQAIAKEVALIVPTQPQCGCEQYTLLYRTAQEWMSSKVHVARKRWRDGRFKRSFGLAGAKHSKQARQTSRLLTVPCSASVRRNGKKKRPRPPAGPDAAV